MFQLLEHIKTEIEKIKDAKMAVRKKLSHRTNRKNLSYMTSYRC